MIVNHVKTMSKITQGPSAPFCWIENKIYQGTCWISRVVQSIFSAMSFAFVRTRNFLFHARVEKQQEKKCDDITVTDGCTSVADGLDQPPPALIAHEISILHDSIDVKVMDHSEINIEELKQEIASTFHDFHLQTKDSLELCRQKIDILWSRNALTPEEVANWQTLMHAPHIHMEPMKFIAREVKELLRAYNEKASNFNDSLASREIITKDTLFLGKDIDIIFKHPWVQQHYPNECEAWENGRLTRKELCATCKREEGLYPILGTLICLSMKKAWGVDDALRMKGIDQFLASELEGSSYTQDYMLWYHSLEKIKTCLYIVPHDPWSDLSPQIYEEACRTISNPCPQITRESDNWKSWIHALLLVAVNPNNRDKQSDVYQRTVVSLQIAIDHLREQYLGGTIPRGSTGNAEGVFDSLFPNYYSKEVWETWVVPTIKSESMQKAIFASSTLKSNHYTSNIFIDNEENYRFDNIRPTRVELVEGFDNEPAPGAAVFIAYELLESIRAEDRTFDISWLAVSQWADNNCYLSAVLIKWAAVTYGYRSVIEHVIKHSLKSF